jgi:hypothetical protein
MESEGVALEQDHREDRRCVQARRQTNKPAQSGRLSHAAALVAATRSRLLIDRHRPDAVAMIPAMPWPQRPKNPLREITGLGEIAP